MPSITPVSTGHVVALKRQTEVRPYFFESTDKDALRPIHVSTSTYIYAVDADDFTISEWEASDNFSTNLTLDEAEKLLEHLTEAITEAKRAGF